MTGASSNLRLVRAWVNDNGALYVVTGPALKQGVKKRIGNNRVSVPRYYYKVLLDYEGGEKKGIGFIMPNEKLSKPVRAYSVTIDSVESFTGFDFYHQLPEDVEKKIESKYSLSRWDFGNEENTRREESKVTAIRRKGITQDGTRCKRTTTKKNGYCWQHN